MNYLDKNNKPLNVGDEVAVPEPNSNDLHNHSFNGTITEFLPVGLCIVTDGDDEPFTIKSNRLELYDESVNQLSPDEIEKLKKLVPSTNKWATIRCNECWWHGTEDDLKLFTQMEEHIKGCPKCMTDQYLYNLKK